MSTYNTMLRDISIKDFLSTSYIFFIAYQLLTSYFVCSDIHCQKLHKLIKVQSWIYASELFTAKNIAVSKNSNIYKIFTNLQFDSNSALKWMFNKNKDRENRSIPYTLQPI